jgi:hypothetical protein
MLAKGAKAANGVLLASMGAVGFCDSGRNGQKADSVVGGRCIDACGRGLRPRDGVATPRRFVAVSEIGVGDASHSKLPVPGLSWGDVSRNAFLATVSGSCWGIWGWSVAKGVAAAVCRDRRGDRQAASPFGNGAGVRGGAGETSRSPSPPRSPTPPGAMKDDLGEHGAADGIGRRDGVSGLGAKPKGGSTASSEVGGDREGDFPRGEQPATAIAQYMDMRSL